MVQIWVSQNNTRLTVCNSPSRLQSGVAMFAVDAYAARFFYVIPQADACGYML